MTQNPVVLLSILFKMAIRLHFMLSEPYHACKRQEEKSNVIFDSFVPLSVKNVLIRRLFAYKAVTNQ